MKVGESCAQYTSLGAFVLQLAPWSPFTFFLLPHLTWKMELGYPGRGWSGSGTPSCKARHNPTPVEQVHGVAAVLEGCYSISIESLTFYITCQAARLGMEKSFPIVLSSSQCRGWTINDKGYPLLDPYHVPAAVLWHNPLIYAHAQEVNSQHLEHHVADESTEARRGAGLPSVWPPQGAEAVSQGWAACLLATVPAALTLCAFRGSSSKHIAYFSFLCQFPDNDTIPLK